MSRRSRPQVVVEPGQHSNQCAHTTSNGCSWVLDSQVAAIGGCGASSAAPAGVQALLSLTDGRKMAVSVQLCTAARMHGGCCHCALPRYVPHGMPLKWACCARPDGTRRNAFPPCCLPPLSQVLCGNYVNGGLDASTPVDSCNIYLTGSEVERLHQALMSGSTSNRRLQAQQRRLRETNCGACISNCYCTNVNNVSAQPSFLCVGCHESRENDVGAATPVRACIPTTRPTCPTRPRPSLPQNCFPSDAQVDVEGVGALRMDQLHAGHKVLTMDASGRQAYEEVSGGRVWVGQCAR